MKRLSIVLGLILAVAVGAAFGGYHYILQRFSEPGPLQEAKVVVISSGSGLNSIATLLEGEGVISDSLIFRLVARVRKAAGTLQAGEYLFEAHLSMEGVLDQLVSGDVLHYDITLPEGLMSVEILALIAAEPALDGPLPQDVPEGRLLPETYRFERGDRREGLVARMAQAQDALKEELWDGRDPGLPIETWEEAIILASIVEKETGVAAERELVASVFINRLSVPMRLQSDPTVAYGITLGAAPLDRELTRADLDTYSAYNTYQIDGLPPGPIANPGRASIEAVLHPAQTSYLYFVADGTGGHAFAETLAQHNENVRVWRNQQGSN